MLDLKEPRLHWFEAGLRHLAGPAAVAGAEPLAAVLTHGTRIMLDDERQLLDATGGAGTACHGFNHPHIGMAVARQLERMPHMPHEGFLQPEPAKLAHRLATLMPEGLERVVFAESGAAAMEEALSLALAYWAARGEGARRKFLAFRGAAQRRLPARQFVAHLPATEEKHAALETLVARHAGKLAALIVEPLVQAEAGWVFHDASVLRRLRTIADRYKILLVFDERFTGFGRTGAMFACNAAAVTPDVVVLSGALTGGTLPLAAIAMREELARAARENAANPMACAAANASLDLFDQEPRLEQAAEIERQLTAALAACRNLPGVREVRVKGAIGVVEFRRLRDPAALQRRFVDAGIYVRTAGNAVALTPALNIEPYDLTWLTGNTAKLLQDFTRRPRRRAAPGQDDLPF